MTAQKGLSNAIAKGVVWMFALRVSLRALGLVSTVILARLLTPEDFGIVAIAMSFFALLSLFKDFGFDTVIIQMRNPEKVHYDTAWTFNFIFSLILALAFVGSSSLIGSLYEVPELDHLIWAVAFLFVIGGAESVGTLDFRKNLTFEKEFKLKIIPKLIGVPCAILLAYWLRSYWALTIGAIVSQLAGICAGYMMHKYRPRITFRASKELFNFSKWLIVNNFIYFINNRSPELFIGKLINPQAAGFFSVSNEIALLPTTELSAAVSRASYPGYAKVANNLQGLNDLYLNVTGSTAILLLPLGIGMAFVADLIVPVFLGSQWLETIPVIQIISIAGLMMALNSNAGYVFLAIGNPRISTLLGLVRVLIFLPALVVLTSMYGLIGAALSMFFTASIMFIVTSAIILKYLPVTIGDLVRAFYRPILGAIVMVMVLELLIGHQDHNGLFQELLILSATVFIGAVVYTLSILILWLIAGSPEGIEYKLYLNFLHKIRWR